MGLNAKNLPSSGTSFERPEPLDPGTYPARLVQVILLGLQAQRPYKGEEKPPVQELLLTYELLDEFMKDENGNDLEDKPRWLSERIPFHNLQADRAKSTQRYYALDADDKADGDWSKLVGTPCMITIVLNEGSGKNAGRLFENISAVSSMRPREAAKAPDLVNPAKVFDPYEPDVEVFNSLPEWVQTAIKGALDYEGGPLHLALNGEKPKEQPNKEAKEKRAVKEELDDEIPW